MNRLSRVALSAQLTTAAVVMLAACGSGRSYDNPPEIAGDSLVTVSSTSSTSTAPPTTAYVPQTAAPTAAPPTQAPPPATYAPTNAPPPPTDPPTTLPPTTPPPTIPERYTVAGGDTLYSISRQLGVSLDALLAANAMTSSSLIVPGQALAVPAGGNVPSATPAPTTPATQAPQPTDPQPPTQAPRPTDPQPQPQPTQPANPDAPPPTVTLPTAPGEKAPVETEVPCPTETGTNADGSAFPLDASNLFDHNATTAWRCPVGGSLELTFTFDAPVDLTSVGLINGYAKLDPTLGTDRYTQNHRVQQATWTFTDGTNTSSVSQSFTDGNRELQTMGVDATVTQVTLTIDSTYPPNHEDPRAELPISEIQFIAG